MILTFPDVCDALYRVAGLALGADAVFDGPPASMPGSSGLAIGATREDTASDFAAPPAGLSGATAEDLTVTCLAWSGSGDVVCKPMRDRVREIVATLADGIATDPTLDGVVDRAEITGGTWMQEQTGEGALVTLEFRIACQTY